MISDARHATVRRMTTWTTIHTMQQGRRIRLDFADQHGDTVGWVVRRACDVYQAYRMPDSDTVPEVVDLLEDGELIGVADNVHDARDLVIGYTPAANDCKVVSLALYRKPQPAA